MFDRRGGGELDEVRPPNLGVLVLDRLEKLQRDRQAGVGAVVDLGRESDRSVGPSTSALAQASRTLKNMVDRKQFIFI